MESTVVLYLEPTVVLYLEPTVALYCMWTCSYWTCLFTGCIQSWHTCVYWCAWLVHCAQCVRTVVQFTCMHACKCHCVDTRGNSIYSNVVLRNVWSSIAWFTYPRTLTHMYIYDMCTYSIRLYHVCTYWYIHLHVRALFMHCCCTCYTFDPTDVCMHDGICAAQLCFHIFTVFWLQQLMHWKE